MTETFEFVASQGKESELLMQVPPAQENRIYAKRIASRSGTLGLDLICKYK